jgi:hypothetical protein
MAYSVGDILRRGREDTSSSHIWITVASAKKERKEERKGKKMKRDGDDDRLAIMVVNTMSYGTATFTPPALLCSILHTHTDTNFEFLAKNT